MPRYAAKLLFQYRVDIDGDSGRRRLCEERIINFDARSPRAAPATAKRHAKRGEFSYPNSDGNIVRFEFVGLLDMLILGVNSDDGEVWYDVRERLTPMERRNRILPSEKAMMEKLERGPRKPKHGEAAWNPVKDET